MARGQSHCSHIAGLISRVSPLLWSRRGGDDGVGLRQGLLELGECIGRLAARELLFQRGRDPLQDGRPQVGRGTLDLVQGTGGFLVFPRCDQVGDHLADGGELFAEGEGDLVATLERYLKLYNHHIPQRALNHQAPIQALKKWQSEKPELFVKRVYKQAGLDSAGVPPASFF